MEAVWPIDDRGWAGPVERTEVVLFSQGLWTPDLDRGRLPEIAALPVLRWLHTETTGTDHPLYERLRQRGIVVTTSAGTMSRPMAEFALGLMLRIVKRMDRWAAAQRERRWLEVGSEDCDELSGKTVGIVGLGHIGSAIATLAHACGMRVLGCRRGATATSFVDELFALRDLEAMIAASDFVILAVPLTPETRGLMSRPLLERLRPHAWLINLARGAVVDEAALIEALREGRFGGACLDVTVEEPLPPESPLWDLPNVIITPHVSATSPAYLERVAQLFLDHFRRHCAGG